MADKATMKTAVTRSIKSSKCNSLSIINSLKACAMKKDLLQGSKIHNHILNSGLIENDLYVQSTLVGMYAKCGALVRAKQILDELPARGVASWNALIAGYAHQGQGKEAVDCFLRMCGEGLPPTSVTYACVLKAVGSMRDVDMGKIIHDEIVKGGMLENNVVLSTALIDMYAKCGVLSKARRILSELSVRDVVSWTALMSGYVQHGQGREALDCFHRMRGEGIPPNAITYACALKACGITQDVEMGDKIHEEVVIQRLLEKNTVLGNAFIDMYAKCGILTKAQRMFDELCAPDEASWSALISGYAHQGRNQETLSLFHQMQRDGFSPNAGTYLCILKACENMQDIDLASKIHDDMVNQGLLKQNTIVSNALIDIYAKCGALEKAQQTFDEIPSRRVVSWNALITGYAHQGQGQEALACFHQMCHEGHSPNAVTYACILKACGATKDLEIGRKIHDEIINQGLLEKNAILGNALIDMYAKCGVLMKAQKIFNEVPVRNVVSWSALIAGYAQQGQGQYIRECFDRMCSEGFSPNNVCWNALIGAYAQQGFAEEALDCFQWMQQEGTAPNGITFLNVLNACSHSGLVDEAENCFDSMKKMYGITPDKDHCTCMVDLFGRARLFNKALGVIEMISLCDDYLPVWSALLGACQNWGNVRVGRYAFEHAVQLDGWDAASYVLMSNVYLAAGMQKEAKSIDCMRKRNASWKLPKSG